MKMLHIAARGLARAAWIPEFIDALNELGELTIIENGERLSDAECAARIRECDVLLTSWGARPVPAELARNPGRLRYVCNLTGTLRAFVPLEIVESDIPVTNWGDAPANRVAEGAMTLLLACLKNLRQRIETVRAGGWAPPEGMYSGTLEKANVGVYGLGVIGRRFVEMLRPFGATMRVFDPYVDELPAGCERAASLEELFASSEIIVVHAGLSDETRGSITAELLAKLPDHAVIVNTARGAIFDQDALFAELERGRLIAGLDVLEPDRLPADHPARQWPNVIFTAHHLSKVTRPGMERMHEICLENLRRFQAGEPLRFVMDRERYLRST